MRYLVITLAFLLTLSIGSTNAQEVDDGESNVFIPPPAVFYGLVKEPIEISLNQHAVITELDMQIHFSKVIEDSRCPSDVTCVWQGRVSIEIGIATDNGSKQIVLSSENTTAPINNEYSLVLVDVEPYPTSKDPIQEKDYDVILKLQRIGPSQSPLEQFKSGIPINEIQCQEEFILIFKSSNGTPVCVKYATGEKLLERGWASCLYDKISYTRGHPCGPSSGHSSSFDSYEDVAIVVIPEGSANPEKQFHLIPDIITVVLEKNNTVTWINQDDTASTLTADDGAWSTGILLPGMSSSVTFNQTGIYEYHGEPHPWKKGKVIVLEEKRNEN